MNYSEAASKNRRRRRMIRLVYLGIVACVGVLLVGWACGVRWLGFYTPEGNRRLNIEIASIETCPEKTIVRLVFTNKTGHYLELEPNALENHGNMVVQLIHQSGRSVDLESMDQEKIAIQPGGCEFVRFISPEAIDGQDWVGIRYVNDGVKCGHRQETENLRYEGGFEWVK